MMPTQMRLPCAEGSSLSPIGEEGWGEGASKRAGFDTLTRLARPGEPPSPAVRERGLLPAWALCIPMDVLRSGSAARSGGGLGGFLGALLRLGLGRRLQWSLAECRLLDDARVAKEPRDPVGRLGADPEPMLEALFLERHPIGMAALQHRVVGAELFDKPPVARAARIGDDDRIERPLLGAAAGEPDLQRHQLPLKKIVIPAQAGIHFPTAQDAARWIPACAGMALGEGRTAHQCRNPPPPGISAERPCRISPRCPSFFIFFIIPAMS